MKRILVTGANGYIGSHVVQSLLNMEAEVIATDLVTDNIDKRAIAIKHDIFSESEKIFEELGCPDVCLHMAWKDGFVHNSNAHMEYLSKHYKFISDMVNGGLKHVAVMGTMHEVGYFEGAIDENTPCNPTSMYGIAKDALRRSISLLLKDKNIIFQWLRAFYIYGDDKRSNSIFAKLINTAENGQTSFPFTSGKNKYDFIHVDELVKLLSCCILQDKVNGIINCCTGEPISLADKVESFIKENNLNIKLVYGAFPDRTYDSPGVWGDNRKIKEVLYLLR